MLSLLSRTSNSAWWIELNSFECLYSHFPSHFLVSVFPFLLRFLCWCWIEIRIFEWIKESKEIFVRLLLEMGKWTIYSYCAIFDVIIQRFVMSSILLVMDSLFLCVLWTNEMRMQKKRKRKRENNTWRCPFLCQLISDLCIIKRLLSDKNFYFGLSQRPRLTVEIIFLSKWPKWSNE